MDDVKSLSHTKWNCKYHIVFAPKYRRKVFYEQERMEIGQILRTLCKRKEVNLLEAEACPDHIHILVEIPLCVPLRRRARREAGSGLPGVREALPCRPVHPEVLRGEMPEESAPEKDRRRTGRAGRRSCPAALSLRPLRGARRSDRSERPEEQILLRPVRAALLETPPHRKEGRGHSPCPNR